MAMLFLNRATITYRRNSTKRGGNWIAFIAFACAALLQAKAATAEPVRIYAAASLKSAMPALIEASGLPSTHFAAPVYGAAGVLREQLAGGEAADLFASGDIVEPNNLEAARGKLLIVPFARNRMCMAATRSMGLTTANLLEKILSPNTRLATSTVGFGPGGTYTLAVFDRAERVHPGAGDILRAKALQLVGSPHAIAPLAGHSPAATVFLTNKADALLHYCSADADLLREVDGLTSVPLPDDLEVHPLYGLAILSDNPDAMRFALFLLSAKGQEVLSRYGFLPIAPLG
jgi:molybdate transport system substrate-binding protein